MTGCTHKETAERFQAALEEVVDLLPFGSVATAETVQTVRELIFDALADVMQSASEEPCA